MSEISFLDQVGRMFDKAAALTDHSAGLLTQIKMCNSVYAMEFPLQRDDGSWDVSDQADGEAVDRAPLQVALPLRGLAACGYAQDPRAERSFAWIDSERLEDGAWPTGYARGNLRKVAGYRKMAHSEGGCRSNTTGVLQCLTLHPEQIGRAHV